MQRLHFVSLGAVVLLGGCSSPIVGVDSGPVPVDAPVAVDAPIAVDTPASTDTPSDGPRPPCDLSAAFGTPELLLGPNTSDSETSAQLSDDETEIFFSGTVGGTPEDIFRMSRASPSGTFSDRTAVAPVSSDQADYLSQVTDDGMLFVSTRTGMGDVYFATRSAPGGPFEAPMLVADLSGALPEGGAWLTAYGAFLARRDVNWEIYYAPRGAVSGFDPPVAIGELSTIDDERAPVVSADELVMYYASSRDEGLGLDDIWVTTRGSRSDPWSMPSLVANVSSAAQDFPNDVSADGCRLYLDSDRSGGEGSFDLYVASRPAL